MDLYSGPSSTGATPLTQPGTLPRSSGAEDPEAVNRLYRQLSVRTDTRPKVNRHRLASTESTESSLSYSSQVPATGPSRDLPRLRVTSTGGGSFERDVTPTPSTPVLKKPFDFSKAREGLFDDMEVLHRLVTGVHPACEEALNAMEGQLQEWVDSLQKLALNQSETIDPKMIDELKGLCSSLKILVGAELEEGALSKGAAEKNNQIGVARRYLASHLKAWLQYRKFECSAVKEGKKVPVNTSQGEYCYRDQLKYHRVDGGWLTFPVTKLPESQAAKLQNNDAITHIPAKQVDPGHYAGKERGQAKADFERSTIVFQIQVDPYGACLPFYSTTAHRTLMDASMQDMDEEDKKLLEQCRGEMILRDVIGMADELAPGSSAAILSLARQDALNQYFTTMATVLEIYGKADRDHGADTKVTFINEGEIQVDSNLLFTKTQKPGERREKDAHLQVKLSVRLKCVDGIWTPVGSVLDLDLNTDQRKSRKLNESDSGAHSVDVLRKHSTSSLSDSKLRKLSSSYGALHKVGTTSTMNLSTAGLDEPRVSPEVPRHKRNDSAHWDSRLDVSPAGSLSRLLSVPNTTASSTSLTHSTVSSSSEDLLSGSPEIDDEYPSLGSQEPLSLSELSSQYQPPSIDEENPQPIPPVVCAEPTMVRLTINGETYATNAPSAVIQALCPEKVQEAYSNYLTYCERQWSEQAGKVAAGVASSDLGALARKMKYVNQYAPNRGFFESGKAEAIKNVGMKEKWKTGLNEETHVMFATDDSKEAEKLYTESWQRAVESVQQELKKFEVNTSVSEAELTRLDPNQRVAFDQLQQELQKSRDAYLDIVSSLEQLTERLSAGEILGKEALELAQYRLMELQAAAMAEVAKTRQAWGEELPLIADLSVKVGILRGRGNDGVLSTEAVDESELRSVIEEQKLHLLQMKTLCSMKVEQAMLELQKHRQEGDSTLLSICSGLVRKADSPDKLEGSFRQLQKLHEKGMLVSTEVSTETAQSLVYLYLHDALPSEVLDAAHIDRLEILHKKGLVDPSVEFEPVVIDKLYELYQAGAMQEQPLSLDQINALYRLYRADRLPSKKLAPAEILYMDDLRRRNLLPRVLVDDNGQVMSEQELMKARVMEAFRSLWKFDSDLVENLSDDAGYVFGTTVVPSEIGSPEVKKALEDEVLSYLENLSPEEVQGIVKTICTYQYEEPEPTWVAV